MKKPKLKIAVKVQGGFGTVLVRANFLHCLYEYVDDADLEIYACGHISNVINFAIFEKQPSIKWYGSEKEWNRLKEENAKNNSFALMFELDLYPKIISKTNEIDESEKLSGLVLAWNKFRKDTRNKYYYDDLRRSKPYEYTKLIIQHKTILNSADIDDILGVGREYRMPVNILQDEEKVLERFGLSGKKYITLQRGINPKLGTNENHKLWPLTYFNELIRLIKTEFSEYVIVQLGESPTHCATLEGIDLNLLGETTWDDIKILLKNAYLHIDGECGMVHLRKALHAGPSLVFFGPTPVDVFGYDGNFNLYSNACKHWCAELRDDWEYNCVKDLSEAPCMHSILPESAMEEIRDYLSNGDTSRVSLYTETKSIIEEISEKYGDRIDKVFFDTWFINYSIWGYEITEVPVSSLIVSVFNGKRWEWLPLEESPAYRFLSGEEGAYEKNMEQRAVLENNIHSSARFNNLIKSVEVDGFDKNTLIVINSLNMVKDGQHRAALWMHKYGKDSKIPVLLVYMTNI